MRNLTQMTLAVCFLAGTGTAHAERLQLPVVVPIPDSVGLGSRSEIERRDEVFSGRVVSIDAPVRTNGGDVLIIADTVIINAPIDTRVRFPITRFWVEATAGFAKQAEHASNVRKAFADWYLWEEAWDNSSKSRKFKTYSLEEIQGPEAGGIAQLPPGLVPYGRAGNPYWENSAVDGPAPPIVDRDLFRSGSITVYARVIKFCEGCKREALLEPHPASGDPYDRERASILIASGVKGARGALGSLFPCFYDAPPPGAVLRAAYCNESIGGRPPSEQYKGGLSGTPGRGGASGNVRIVIVGNRSLAKTERDAQREFTTLTSKAGCDPVRSLPQSDDRTRCELPARLGQSIAALTEVSGGAPAHIGQLRTPAKVALSGTRSSFAVEQPTDLATLPTLFGEDGTLSIEERTPQEALTEIAGALTAIDLRKHDLASTGRRSAALNPPGITPSLLARDLLGDMLSSFVVGRQVRLIDSVEGGSFVSSPGRIIPEIFETLDCRLERVAGLSAAELEYLGQYCDLLPIGGANLIQSYLLRTGGLLTLPRFSAAPDVQAQQTIVRLTELNGAVAQLDSGVQRIEGLLFEKFTAEDRVEFDGKLATLAQALASAKAELQAKGDLFKILSEKVKAASSSVGTLAAGVGSGNYLAAASAIGPTIKDVGSVLRTMNESGDQRTASSKNKVAEVEAKIAIVKKDYDAFLKTVERLRQESAARSDATIGRILTTRRQVAVDHRVFSSDFESLLKFSIINYARDPSARLISLQTPLRATREAITRWPDPATRSFPARSILNCSGSPQRFDNVPPDKLLSCALVSAPVGRSYQFALAPNLLASLPLVVIAKSQGSLPINYYGIVMKANVKTYTPQARNTQLNGAATLKEVPEAGFWAKVRGWFAPSTKK